MGAECKQQLQSEGGDGLGCVRGKLQTLIKFHDIIGLEMDKVRVQQSERSRRLRDMEAERVEVDQRLVSCLRVLAEATADKEQEIVRVNIAAVVMVPNEHRNIETEIPDPLLMTMIFLLVVAVFALSR